MKHNSTAHQSLPIIIVCLALAACAANTSRADGDASTDPGDGAVDDGAANPDTGVIEEICNALDDDSDGLVDEGCSCIDQATQPCYPAPHPAPDGCDPGTQICESSAWGACEGAEFPLPSMGKCCDALDENNPQFDVLDGCMAVYPAAVVPGCMDLSGWDPNDVACDFANVTANVADEFVDQQAGGITVAHVEAGRDHTRGLALTDFGVDEADVLFENQPPIEIEGQEGCNPGGRAFAWGSILYRTPMGAVGEIVYHYIGICANNCDAEAFLRSVEPLEVCSEGTVL